MYYRCHHHDMVSRRTSYTSMLVGHLMERNFKNQFLVFTNTCTAARRTYRQLCCVYFILYGHGVAYTDKKKWRMLKRFVKSKLKVNVIWDVHVYFPFDRCSKAKFLFKLFFGFLGVWIQIKMETWKWKKGKWSKRKKKKTHLW